MKCELDVWLISAFLHSFAKKIDVGFLNYINIFSGSSIKILPLVQASDSFYQQTFDYWLLQDITIQYKGKIRGGWGEVRSDYIWI